MATALCWFRADLRTEDHTALTAACRRAEHVVGVFVLCPTQWREHGMAPIRAAFVLRTLRVLRRDLATLGIPLRVLTVGRFAAVPAALLSLARDLAATAIHCHREYEWNELQRDLAVESACRKNGLAFVQHSDQTVVEPGVLQTKTGSDYRTFTPFKRSWLDSVGAQGVAEALPTPRPRQRLAPASDAVPDTLDGFDLSADRPDLWPAGAAEAQRRLHEFATNRAAHYADQRNTPGTSGTSALSSYLAVGAISAATCVRAALEMSDAWLSELIWREFYRHVVYCFPRVSRGQAFRPIDARVPWRADPEAFDAWCHGRTGYPLVDAGMRQLLTTGWMHNRVRMVTAMFLTKHLLIHWRRGESWFMKNLIDGDLANNNGGWQWCSSTGTDAAPYFRVFNPWTQSKRFDPEGQYIRRFVPELRGAPAAALHDPGRIAATDHDYPSPIVDHALARERALDALRDRSPGDE